MKHTFLLSLIIFTVISFGACRKSEEVEEVKALPAPTEEEQAQKSANDLELYKKAKSEGNPELCEAIEFMSLRTQCVEKLKADVLENVK